MIYQDGVCRCGWTIEGCRCCQYCCCPNPPCHCGNKKLSDRGPHKVGHWSENMKPPNVRGIVDFVAAVDLFDMPLTKIAWPKIVHPKPWQFAWWRWKFVWARDRAVDTFLVLIGRREARKHWEGDDY